MNTEIKIKEELINQLLKTENFEKLMKLRSFYDDDLKPLIKARFWDEMEVQVRRMIDHGELAEWDIDRTSSVFFIYKKQWEIDNNQFDKRYAFGLGWNHIDGGSKSRLYYGICANSNLKNIESLCEKLESAKCPLKLTIDSKSISFPAWYYHNNYNFEEQNTLVKFLPSYVEERVKEFIAVLVSLKDSYSAILDGFVYKNR